MLSISLANLIARAVSIPAKRCVPHHLH